MKPDSGYRDDYEPRPCLIAVHRDRVPRHRIPGPGSADPAGWRPGSLPQVRPDRKIKEALARDVGPVSALGPHPLLETKGANTERLVARPWVYCTLRFLRAHGKS